jgi:hypothetical protein
VEHGKARTTPEMQEATFWTNLGLYGQRHHVLPRGVAVRQQVFEFK